jgi:hypothetical protein
MGRAPELRHVIYDELLPTQTTDDALIVTCPRDLIDQAMTMARQPAITRVSRQMRAECLAMFYAKSCFAAYIKDSYFDPLYRWIRCITSNKAQVAFQKLCVHVFLMDKVWCEYDIYDLMQSWMGLEHETIMVEVHNTKALAEYWQFRAY